MATDKPAVTIKAPERLTVESAEDLFGELVAAAEDSDCLRVDLSEVIAVDTAGLQLLVVLKQSLEGRGGSCELATVPPTLVERARLLGVGPMLDLA